MAKRMKEKAALRRENRDKRPKAIAKYVRISSRKVRIVIDLIRGKQVDEALAILQFTPKAAAPYVAKVLTSAVANAENNPPYLNRDNLYVAEAYANQGPTMKRFMPRAKGSASSILKRSSHITVILDQKKEDK